jgi:hypothetical protein
MFHALSNQRRRYVLTYLGTNGPKTTVRQLSEQLTAWENDVGIGDVTYKQRKRTYTSLIQIHLQTLHDGGFVRRNRGRGEIGLTNNGNRLADILDRRRSEVVRPTLLQRWKHRFS